jgi:tripartite-type tricarboxylate transporter receptor subunit TctC
MGVYGPAGMPRNVVSLLNGEVQKVVALPDVQKRMLDSGLEPQASTPERLEEMLKANIAKVARIVHDAKIRID